MTRALSNLRTKLKSKESETSPMALKSDARPAPAPRLAKNGMPFLENETFFDAKIIFRNFSGAEKQYNRAGDRNFGLILSPEDAERMARLGWNVKMLKPREEGDEPTPWIEVAVSYREGSKPPMVMLVTDRNKTELDQQTVGMIDRAHILKTELTIRAYNWEAQGKKGYKAYLKSAYVTIFEDELDRRYSDIPDSRLQANEPINEWDR